MKAWKGTGQKPHLNFPNGLIRISELQLKAEKPEKEELPLPDAFNFHA